MPALTNTTVLRWAAARGAISPREVADLLRVSPVAVRAWRASPHTAASPRILLIVAAIEAGPVPDADITTPDQLASIQRNAGLPSLAALAAQLSVSRQTLHSWGRTCRVPSWVPLACAGLTALPGRPIT